MKMFRPCTDVLSLNKCDMFGNIRAGLPVDKNLTQNLIESVDDLLFAWDSAQCCLLVINWRLVKLKGVQNVKYQTLVPSLPQNYQVEKILSSPEGSLIALAGSRGLSVLELPKRWGTTGQFLNGKEKITCKTNNLDEYFFINNAHLELLQLRWHPGSPTDSHIVALLSDNTLRLYTETVLRHVWRIGPVPCAPPASPNSSGKDEKKNLTNIPSIFSLGETAVDFDIAPPRVVSGSYGDTDGKSSVNKSYLQNSTGSGLQNTSVRETERVEWPIIILRGNGNIYVLCAGIDTDKPQLQGPLTMTPQVGDNYGIDSCSLLLIPSLPPALVIAESTGKLHHALMLECAETEEGFNEIDSSLIIHPSQWELNVLETVELELGLPDNSNKLNFNTSPIHLKRDFINELRYFAYHNTGLHVITMNFIKELRHFIEVDEPSSSIQFSAPPHAEYLVCTKAEDQTKINTVLGFVLLQMPSSIVLLLGSGEIISLNVIIDPNLLTDFSLTKPANKSRSKEISANSPIQKIMNESFVTHIQNILRRTVSQPILSFDKSTDVPPDMMYILLSQAIQVLREQYFRKHEKARTEILKRVKILKLIKEQQRKEVEHLEKEKELIRNNAEHLAEKYEEVYEKQRVLSAKCQDLIRQANIRLPNNTVSDKEFTENVEKIHETAKKLNKQLQQAKEVMKKQQYHIEKYTSKAEQKNIELPPKQENLIKEILGSLTSEIDSQIKDIKKINNVLNI